MTDINNKIFYKGDKKKRKNILKAKRDFNEKNLKELTQEEKDDLLITLAKINGLIKN